MKRIISKKAKNKSRKKLNSYWLLPNSILTSDIFEKNITKLANGRLKKEKLIGTLSQDKEGFVYINISNNFIHGLFPLVNDEDAEKPPFFSKNEIGGGIGANISAISD